jgi:hypothetical protein
MQINISPLSKSIKNGSANSRVASKRQRNKSMKKQKKTNRNLRKFESKRKLIVREPAR